MDVRRDGLDSADDVAQVRLVVVVERGGNADDDGVHEVDFGVVCGGGEAGLLGLLDCRGRNADDVRTAVVECVYLILRDVKAGDLEALVAEKQGQGQSYIPHADNADAGLARFHLADQFRERCALCAHVLDCKTLPRLRGWERWS